MGGLDKNTMPDPDEVDLSKKAWDCWKRANAHLGKWLKEAKENYDMVAGEQWTADDRASMVERKRVPVVYNRVGTIIDSVSGHEVNNRQEVKYIPREIGDVAPNEVLTAAAQWVRDLCDAEDEESDAFVDVLVAGVACTETRMDYELDEEGLCVIERVDITQMRWDENARKRNLADRKWCARLRHMPREEVEERWPDKAESISLSPAWEDNDDEPYIEDPRNDYNKLKLNPDLYGQDSKGKYPVLQYQWYEVEQVYKVLSPDSGQIIEVDSARFEELKAVYMGMGGVEPQHAKIPRRVYKQAFICGGTVMEEGPAPCKHDFTFQFITGKRDRNNGTWYGLVRPMVDPQRWANKFLSETLFLISTNAKGGLMVEEGAPKNIRKFEQDWAKGDSIVHLNAGGLAKVSAKPVSQIPQAIPEVMQFSIQSIMDCPGVNPELLGLVDRNQAGVVERQRTQASLVTLAGLFDALRLYRKKQGRVLAYFIEEYMSDGRLIRIVGEEGEQYVPLIRQPGNIKYDVVVDSAPTARDVKERTFMALRELIPMAMQSGIPIPPDVIRYAPLPTSLVQKWENMIKQSQQQPPDPMQQAMQQTEVAQRQANVQKTESEVTLNAAKTVETYADAGTKVVSALRPEPAVPGNLRGPNGPVRP